MRIDAAEGAGPESRVPARAFAWLAEHRDRFIPTSSGSTASEIFARKAFVELALFVGLSARAQTSVPAAAYGELLNCVTSVASRASYKELAARDRRAFLLYAPTCGALRLAGCDDPEFRWTVEAIAGGRCAAAFEHLPFRHLDLLHTLDTAGIEHTLPRAEDVLPFTTLLADPSTIEIRESDAYAITHTVFYASDFGTKNPTWPASCNSARVVALLDALLMLYRVRGNSDLVAELICSHACLGVHGTRGLASAWEYLSDLQYPDGRVPGPPGIVAPEDAGGETDSQEWQSSYHTTLVVALAGVLTQEAGGPGAVEPPVEPALQRRLRDGLRRGVEWVAEESHGWTVYDAIPALAAGGLAARRVDASRELIVALRAIVDRIDRDERGVNWSAQGSDVILSFALTLQEGRIECRSLRRFLEVLATELTQQPEAQREAPAVVEQLVMLHLLPASAASGSSRAQERLGSPRDTGRHRPVDVATRIVQITGGDSGKFDGNRADWLATGERLAVALADACREYRLGEAAALLRGLIVLGWTRHRVVTDAVDFLTRQRTYGGGFGYTVSDHQAARGSDQRRWTQSILVALADFDRESGESPHVLAAASAP